MKSKRVNWSVLILIGLLVSAGSVNAATTVVVSTTAALLKSVKTLKSGTTLSLKSKTYVLNDTLRIATSNVAVIGEPGTKLVLDNNVNKPVVAIGSQDENPSSVTNNVTFADIEIDGNKNNQTSETQADKSWIRNNGIDVRSVTNLTINNVISNNNRSGGLVISNDCSDIHIMNSSFRNNYYDGIAYYDSQRIYTQNSSMIDNNGAGISLDLGITDSIFSNCIVDGSGDVGIFIRFASELRFDHCVIKNSASWAAFMGHNEEQDDAGVHDSVFSGCHILNNVGGIMMSSETQEQSSYNSIVGCVFRGNEQSGRRYYQTEGSTLYRAGNINI